MPNPYGTSVASTYTLPSSIDNNIAALLTSDLPELYRWGTSVIGSSADITYSIPGDGAVWDTSSTGDYNNLAFPGVSEANSSKYSILNAAEASIFRGAMQSWDDIANINITKVADTATEVGDIRVAYTTGGIMTPTTIAYSVVPTGSQRSGDIWFNNNGQSHTSDQFSFYAMHETGHALGLKHPFEGANVLPNNLDNFKYTVMSYNASEDSNSGTSLLYETTSVPEGPMLLDIQAIQYLYGANMNYRTGDDVYVFHKGTDYYRTIWDAGGTDTIQYTGNDGAKINLNAGEFSALGNSVNFTVTENGSEVIKSEEENVAIAYNVSIENAIGGDGNDELTGNALDNVLTGNAGGDIIRGRAGNDTMLGGAGNDIYEVTEADDIIQENVNEGTDTAWVYINNYTLTDNVEHFHFGKAWLRGNGNELNNVMTGSTGSETLIGGGGNDTMIGGDGHDIYEVTENGDVITEYVDQGIDTAYVYVDGYTLGDNVENFIYGAAWIRGHGNGLNNTMTGNAGNEVFIGGAGNDTMIGGLGSDVYEVTEVNDTIKEDLNQGVDTAYVYVDGYTLDDNVENFIYGAGWIRGNGNALDNIMTGSTGGEILVGGAGNDTMIGGVGNDVYEITEAGDVITEYANEGVDTAYVYIDNYTLADNVENIYLSTAGLRVNGNNLDNRIYGTDGTDIIAKSGGNDIMTGGLGDDVYGVSELGDIVTELPGGGNDTIYSSVDGYTLPANVENLIILSDGSSTESSFYGSAGDNTIAINSENTTTYGMSGDDTITGSTGKDTIVGGTGNDILYGNSGSDNLLGALGDDALYGNAGIDYLWGNEGNDYLSGGAGEDFLYGGKGNDSLFGGNGTDSLAGFEGDDILTGGAGSDAFLFSPELIGYGKNDTITDFSLAEGDRIFLLNVLEGYDESLIQNYVDIAAENGGTTIRVNASGAFTGAHDMNIHLENVDLYAQTGAGSEADLLQHLTSSASTFALIIQPSSDFG